VNSARDHKDAAPGRSRRGAGSRAGRAREAERHGNEDDCRAMRVVLDRMRGMEVKSL
jgi:hypothetical protein